MVFVNGDGVGSGRKVVHFLPVGGRWEYRQPLLRDGSLISAHIQSTFLFVDGFVTLVGRR